MPEIQKFWIFGFYRNMLFEMLSWNWFEMFFSWNSFLTSFFWPYDISYAGHLRVCQLLIWPICWIVISLICTSATSGFNTFYWKTISLPFKDRKATISALTLPRHNLPIDRAKNLFKPPKEANHRLGSVLKKLDTFVFKRFLVRRHNWGGFEFFGWRHWALRKRSGGNLNVFL